MAFAPHRRHRSTRVVVVASSSRRRMRARAAVRGASARARASRGRVEGRTRAGREGGRPHAGTRARASRREVIAGTATAIGTSGAGYGRGASAAIAPGMGAVKASDARAMLDALEALTPGTRLANGAFEVTSTRRVMPYDVVAVELEHVKTGAKHLHVGADDSNNSFNVAFRTTPRDSTGVAHVLEHTVLCGSEKYPVRDPFFNMLRRSLSTFMNAMTASDFTCYPFSTMNRVDYKNLLDVYLDAAFFPKIAEIDFSQEGHRFEFAKMEDPTSDLIYKGIVFNEMKGAMGSQSARYGRALGEHLFPTSTYHWNSGGDPINIPDLTYEQLRNFHAVHYHPSNSKFYTYGDFPLEETLQQIEDSALSRFDKLDVSKLVVEDEKRFIAPKRVEVTVPADAVVADKNKQSIISLAWLMMNQIKEPVSLDNFALGVASDLLTNGPQSYFYEALLEPRLGSAFASGTGYNGSRRETSFAVGLKDVAESDVNKVEKIIEEVLERIAREGFPRERVEAVMHQIELDSAVVTTQFGLYTGFGAYSTWVHDGDALNALRTPELAAKLNSALDADPQYWQKLIKKWFLDNKHRLTITARTDEEYDKKLDEAEKKKLKQIEKTLSDQDKQKIVANALLLKDNQDKKEDVSVLPTLVVSEAVEKGIKRWGSKHMKIADGVPLQYDEQPTNGVVYFTTHFDLDGLPERLVPYLDLFTDFMDQLGTEKMKFKDLAEEIKLRTGGFSVGSVFRPSADGTKTQQLSLSVSGHALERNVDAMFDILTDLTESVKWRGEEERLKLLLARRATALGSSVGQQGMTYARALAGSQINAASAFGNETGGMPHVGLVSRLSKENATEEVENALSEIAAYALRPERVQRCRIACQKESFNAAERCFAQYLKGIKPIAATPSDKDTVETKLKSFKSELKKVFVSVTGQTNYCSAALPALPYTHPDAPALFLLAQALSAGYLHREIREKGGAYGGGCASDPMNALFTFFSYRDPNTTETLDTFAKSIDWATTEGNITKKELEEAQLRAFKTLDAPLAPSARGQSSFVSGVTEAERQRFRDGLLCASPEDLRRAAARHLAGVEPAIAIVGSAEKAPMGDANWINLDAQGAPRVV
jgi:Zn-dependent M16 (insulinase) family peptidase